MKGISLLIVPVLCSLLGQAQQHKAAVVTIPEKTKRADTCISRNKPEFPGGDAGWMRYLNKSLKMPADSTFDYMEESDKGTFNIPCEFEVMADGSTRNVTFSKEIHPAMKKVVKDIVLHSPRWIPATQGCKPVNRRTKKLLNICLTGE